MNEIKVIVMDIDGTLFNNQKEISEETFEILMKVQKKGIRLILASGRPTSGLVKIAKKLDMKNYHGLLVCYNGSKVVDVETSKTLFNQPLSIDEGKAVLEHLKKFDVIPMIDKDEYMYVNNVFNNKIHYNGEVLNIIEYESRGGNYKLCEISDLSGFIDYEVNKILVAAEADYLNEHYKDIMAPFTDLLSCMFTAPFYFEFTASGIDKAKALNSVLTELGFNANNVIAIGDGHNDISMLKYAGVGVAMGNGVPELKEIADFVTLDNDHNGIAHAIEKYLGLTL